MRTFYILIVLATVGGFVYRDHAAYAARRDCIAGCGAGDAMNAGPTFCRIGCNTQHPPTLLSGLWGSV